jgi:hypothetical protein
VGEELAGLLQVLAERAPLPHPVVQVAHDHPEVVEHATDSLVSWVRGAQDWLVPTGRSRS